MKPAVVERFELVQGLRAFAAIAVVFGHAEHEALGLAAAAKGFSTFVMEWTGAGVDLFFVISGFVMVYASQRLFAAPGGGGTFLFRRVSRIVPLYWAATTVFLATMLASPAMLTSAAPSAAEIVQSYLFVPYRAAGAEMMQPIYKLGWTLNYEMFFYLLFALFIARPRRQAVASVLMALVGLVVLGAFVPRNWDAAVFWTHPMILEFGFGVLLAHLRLEGWRIGPGIAAALVLAAMTIMATAAIPTHGSPLEGWRPLLWGIPAALIVAAATLPGKSPALGPFSRLAGALGDASYSIYLLHPILIRVLRIVWDKSGLSSSASPWLFVGAVVCATVLASLLAYRWFEKPLTQWLQDRARTMPAAIPAHSASPG